LKRLNWLKQNYHVHKKNSDEHDFIRDGLGGMGYNHMLYKKTIPNYKFIRGWFQIKQIFK
jgi:hypothetical protein